MFGIKVIQKCCNGLYKPTNLRCFYSTSNSSSDKPFNTLKSEEINFFNTQAKDWWNPEGTMKPLHRMNPVRVKYIVDRLKSIQKIPRSNSVHLPLQGLTLMDIGCGAGLLTESLSRLGGDKVIGLDAAQNNILMACSHANLDKKLQCNLNEKKLEYIESTIENYIATNPSVLTADGGFDVVCSLEVIEHVDNPQEFVNYCSKVLKPGGSMFISTINRTYLSYLSTILAAEYILRLVPIGTHHWNQFVTPSDLSQFLQKSNLSIQDSKGLFYNPLTSNWTLINDNTVNYIIHATKKL
ncbi:hypothetical protein DLAC_09630 [Tieghemostelium lacteum]|uniref:Ubiquinone biosynthesis O-methyltransferase, mitochondrial n=1 Tax=Tieghemostelium lacteum TaxID=361077 RepID=A0A151Z6U9_TIELA|nr:hypothetical protein DLAC_09630 [Tieghemostelium lacteum]|eukprot:KYQ89665.1 hypothetical protein DLAC_09630 [Tieghemostelium lacteum]